MPNADDVGAMLSAVWLAADGLRLSAETSHVQVQCSPACTLYAHYRVHSTGPPGPPYSPYSPYSSYSPYSPSITSCCTRQDPTEQTKCLAQCFHIVPDVYYAHL